MIRTTLLLLALFVSGARADCPPTPDPPSAAQAAAWAAHAPDRGPLWRITRDGRSSWLYGTLHLGKADWPYAGPALRRAWAETEVLAVELDPADLMPVLAARPPAAPLPAPLARRMEAQAAKACLPPGVLAAFPPVLQLSTLTLLEARRDGFDAGFGQDMALMARARAEGRPVRALESAAEQLAALEPAADELTDIVDGALAQLQRGQVRGPLRRLADAWARGDVQALADYPAWCQCADTPAERAWLTRLNDDRNGPLAERITALHAQGQRVLVAVGALHMSGPQALPRLLAERGFHVEAIVPAK